MSDAGFPSPARDWCDEPGAIALKAIIEAYWRERGWLVTAKLEQAGFVSVMRRRRHDLRSDLRNGLPTTRIVEEQRDAA